MAWPVVAGAFSGVASPARFELRTQPGQKLTEVLEIGNDATVGDEFLVSTNDWTLSKEGGTVFFDELQPGSCRPWVRIERRSVKLAPRGRKRFRFEVHVPADAPAQECRFALMIEKSPEVLPVASAGNIQFPLQGRIGVIVYVAVGAVAPQLSVQGLGSGVVNGLKMPLVSLKNAGSAHGRAEGVLEGIDAAGVAYEFSVSSFPVLPGETRNIIIWPNDLPDGKKPVLKFPVKLRGDIELPSSKYPVNATIN